jgi:hypothetical protein
VSKPLPTVSPWAEPFVDDEDESQLAPRPRRRAGRRDAFFAKVAEMQADARRRQTEHGRRAARWAGYTVVCFLFATHTPGWWSFFFWCVMLTWGLGAILQLEAWNIARLESTLSPFEL